MPSSTPTHARVSPSAVIHTHRCATHMISSTQTHTHTCTPATYLNPHIYASSTQTQRKSSQSSVTRLRLTLRCLRLQYVGEARLFRLLMALSSTTRVSVSDGTMVGSATRPGGGGGGREGQGALTDKGGLLVSFLGFIRGLNLLLVASTSCKCRAIHAVHASAGGWKGGRLSFATKRLSRSLVFPIATYASEYWILNQEDKEKMGF